MTAEPQPSSLATRAGEALRAGLAGLRAREPGAPSPRRDWRVAGSVAGLIALGPLATILGGSLLAARAHSDARALETKAAPRIASANSVALDRETLATTLHRPTLGQVIEALSRALPPEASLLRAERGKDGLLTIEASAPDPDKLRAALRHEPALAGLRDAGQRQGDAAMIVAFKEAP